MDDDLETLRALETLKLKAERRAWWYATTSGPEVAREHAKDRFMELSDQIQEIELAAESETFSGQSAFPVDVPDFTAEATPVIPGVLISAPSPSGNPFQLYNGRYEEVMKYCNAQMVTSVLGYRVPEKTERETEEDTYFEITGNPMAGKLTTYAEWRAEYLRTGMSLPFERMMELVTPEIRTKALDGEDPEKPRKQKYWYDIDGRPHPKPARGKPSSSVIDAVLAITWILLNISLFLVLFL